MDWYLWVKAVHIIAVIAWMAGMLYLPRLFVYHAGVEAQSPESEMLKVMERRLLRIIINPAMAVAWILGLILLFWGGGVDWQDIWLYIKLAAVIVMSAIHGAFSRWRKDFENDSNKKSAKFYRTVNEVPTLLMIVIVIMVIVRPF